MCALFPLPMQHKIQPASLFVVVYGSGRLSNPREKAVARWSRASSRDSWGSLPAIHMRTKSGVQTHRQQFARLPLEKFVVGTTTTLPVVANSARKSSKVQSCRFRGKSLALALAKISSSTSWSAYVLYGTQNEKVKPPRWGLSLSAFRLPSSDTHTSCVWTTPQPSMQSHFQ